MNKEVNNSTNSFYRKFKNFTGTLGWIIFALLITIAMFLLLVLITNKIAEKRHEKPIMGLYTIVSPSMTGSIDVYDVVFVLRVPTKLIHRGDVITFRAEDTIFGDTPVTHRIIEKYTDDDGSMVYVTKGDFNQYKDKFYAYERNLVGKVLFKIPQLGRIQFFLVGRKGWFVVVLLPALGIIAMDIFKILKLMSKKQGNKDLQQAEEVNVNSHLNIQEEILVKEVEIQKELEKIENKKKTKSKNVAKKTQTTPRNKKVNTARKKK